MINKKGFTLMELLVAMFIAGMVTTAIVFVWKTASMQTIQGQRHTIIQNQVSNFRRQLYTDFYRADIITFPSDVDDGEDLLLAGIKKAKKISDSTFKTVSDNSTKEFAYCIKTETEGNTVVKRYINRYEQEITSSDEPIGLSDYTDDDMLSKCTTNGIPVLSNVLSMGSRFNGGRYILKGVVQKIFSNQANTTPIRIEIDELLLQPGGN